jgi:RNA polymerase sigma-70 factor, ECF subfamily
MPEPPPSFPPLDVVAGLRSGEDRERNFELIYQSCHRAVKGYFVRRGASVNQAEDLTQEVFLAVHAGASSLQDPAAFRSWLFGIAHNVFLHHLRNARRESPMPVAGEGDTQAFDRLPDLAPTPLGQTLHSERVIKLRDAIEALPQQMRACVKLSLVEDLDYTEIAQRLGLSVNSVKVHMHRARRNLSNKLGPLFEPGEAAGE